MAHDAENGVPFSSNLDCLIYDIVRFYDLFSFCRLQVCKAGCGITQKHFRKTSIEYNLSRVEVEREADLMIMTNDCQNIRTKSVG
jgi:hypothetical protein